MKILFIFVCIITNAVLSQDEEVDILSLNVDYQLLKEASITASATCGMNGPEKYCRLVDEGIMMEHSPDILKSNVMCDICDDRNETKRHPIEYTKFDDQNLWWQSPSMAQGAEYQRVNITIDLKQVYQIVYILLKMADSPRPGTWVLERSIEGVTYEPWIYFADTPYDCFNLFQRYNPKIRLTTYEKPWKLDDDEVFCTTYYSQPNSLNSGEVIISLIIGRKSLTQQNGVEPGPIPLKLINFLSARFIRFRFLKALTLAADLMTHKDHLEKSIYNRYYYSLRSIQVGGKCICNDHADKCKKEATGGVTMAKCICKHFTCGSNCETCCPLYNQKPWSQGGVCEECNCNRKTDKCIYNQTVATMQMSFNKFGYFDGGGVCVNCNESTTGINCEKCKFGYYRPWNIGATESFPCRQCSCHGSGTLGTCVSNGEEAHNQKPGDCICKNGYKGSMCDQCELGYERNENGECQACPCSIDGSVSNSLYRCQPPCNCKVNVDVKTNCHRCKQNFFNLQSADEEGCQACYCFGITDRCSSLSAQNLQVQTVQNWKVTTLARDKEVDPKMSSLLYPIFENSIVDQSLGSPSVYYLSAPDNYLGNWLTSYTSYFQYVIKIDKAPGSTVFQIDSADVIIRCGSAQIFHSVSSEDPRLQRMVSIPLNMKSWKYRTLGGAARPPSKDDFMTCLVNVTSLLIKGKYFSNQLSIGLLNVTLERGDIARAINQMPGVEKCECPPQFSGLSCEACVPGQRRVNNILVNGHCEPCTCFQHSNSCDAFSGDCKDCAHNTTGKYCDSCSPGFYGNPRTGSANACTKCACPLEDHQLTNMCSTFGPSKYICHECTDKSAGYHCQRCMDGYYGDPLKKIRCQKCLCHDNEEKCDNVTGECTCSYNTMGSSCDTCVHGFYGDALKRGCKKCNCAIFGSDSQFCDKTSGLCSCKPNFSGRTCESCVEGLYLKGDKCEACSCDPVGRIPSKQFCNSVTGQCLCRKGVTGALCDRCLPDHYGFPDCKSCACSNHSKSMNCDPIDGSCKCGLNVADSKCNACLNSFFWSTLTDCSPCNCGRGSSQSLCEMNSGQCPCTQHVIGRTCDQCQFNYFGISPSGCRKCPQCSRGRVCNDEGFCVCPPNTEGEYCQRCADQNWGYNSTTGCKSCDCSSFGSPSPTCDAQTGLCLCRPQYQGAKCDKCSPDLFGFPNCQACNCNKQGILPNQVNACDGVTGNCACKVNVEGDKCDVCKNGTFGLDGSYSAGCYSCFCSGRSLRCSSLLGYRIISNGQHKYHIYNDIQQFVSGKDHGVILLSLRNLPKFGWPFQFFRPVFIDVTSLLSIPDLSILYRSVLMIADIDCQSTKCGRENSKQTEVIMESYGGLMELHYVITHPTTIDGRIVVELSETSRHGQWSITKFDNKSILVPTNLGDKYLTAVARDLFMLALMNVSKVKLQLYSSSLNPDEVKLTLKTFSPVQTSDNVGKSVVAVEKCACDSTTIGLHCENAIHGYYRKPVTFPEILFNVSVRIGIRIKIDIEKCSCNGHSKNCNRETGRCDNCMDNTAGAQCQLCADGFYGDPRNGGQCFPCECPSREHNYGKTCGLPSSSIVSDCECLEGYTGKLCHNCQDGFFGKPLFGIKCKRCNCSSEGSLSTKCDDSGKCVCAPGVTGDRCDQCSANSAVENKKCTNCLIGCTKELFLKVNNLNDTVTNFKWQSLPSKAESMLEEFGVFVVSAKRNLTEMKRLLTLSEEIEKSVAEFKNKKEALLKKLSDAVRVKDAYNATLGKIYEIFKDINETIDFGKHAQTSIGAINNATDILKQMENIHLQMPDATSVKQQLSIVQNHLDNLNRVKKRMQVQEHSSQLVSIKNLVAKTELANTINKSNRKYLENKNATISRYEKKMNELQTKLLDKDKEYESILSEKATLERIVTNLKLLLSKFALKINMTADLVLKIQELLKRLAKETPTRNGFLIPDSVREMVQKMVMEAAILIKNLLKNFQLLSRAEEAKHAYSNIIKNIKDVEDAINTSRQQLENSRNQLRIDKYSINIADVTAKQNAIAESKKEKGNIWKKLNDDYKVQEDKVNLAMERNKEDLSKMSERKTRGNTLTANISAVHIAQDINKQKIDDIKAELSTFEMPKSTDVGTRDQVQKAEDLRTKHNGVRNDTNTMIVTLKELRESLRKIRERLSKRRVYSELGHGAAAKSPEPIRLGKDCVRHYKTYFLPKSNAFSLELYLNPQFADVQNLVLLGFDNSAGTNLSFALTIEKNKQIKFWYDVGLGLNELSADGTVFMQGKYFGLSISSLLGKWEIKQQSMEEKKDRSFQKYSVNKTGASNIVLGPESHIFVGGFPSDQLLRRSDLHLGGQLVEYLRENYRTKYYKGCIYGAKIMNVDLGLQDFHDVEDLCKESSTAEYVLKMDFNCKINTAHVESFKTVIRRYKREEKKDYNIHFNGHGYVMINTSQPNERNKPCLKVLDKALSIYTIPQSKINEQTFQFVAAFANEKLNIGFVIGQKNGKFQRAYWNGAEEVAMQDISMPNNRIVWKTFDNSNSLIFGKSELCDRDSYLYLGGVPMSETGLREKLIRLMVPYNGYTGSMEILLVEMEVFRKSSTRFVDKNLRNKDEMAKLKFHSLLIPSGTVGPILLDSGKYNDVLERGFSVNVDFMGEPVSETLTLVSISSEQTKLSLTVSPDLEFTVLLNKETISVRKTDKMRVWGKHFIVINLQLKMDKTEIYVMLNEPQIKMKEFSVWMDSKVSRIEIGQRNVQRPFYIYDMFLGDRLVNFDHLVENSLPPNAYLKLIQSQLTPEKQLTDKIPEVARADFRSEDYPRHSGWFNGALGNVVRLDSATINRYSKEGGNNIAIRLASHAMRPELILTINFTPTKTLTVFTINGQAVLYDTLTKWSSILRVPIINTEWHLLVLSASTDSDGGLMVKIDGHTFDFPDGPFSFTTPILIEMGGFNGAEPSIDYNGTLHQMKMFTGCLDSITINGQGVSLPTGSGINQCPRVLEFLDTGVEILGTYSGVYASQDLVKLEIDYDQSKKNISLVIEFKFKYTGNEQGGLLVTADVSNACAIVVHDRKLNLNCMNLQTKNAKSDSFELTSNKWYKISFQIFHMPDTVSFFAVSVDDAEMRLNFWNVEAFSRAFLTPEIYLGGHPRLDTALKLSLMKTDQNFVGCISTLSVLESNKPVVSAIRQSRFVEPGRCSVDKFSYLRA